MTSWSAREGHGPSMRMLVIYSACCAHGVWWIGEGSEIKLKMPIDCEAVSERAHQSAPCKKGSASTTDPFTSTDPLVQPASHFIGLMSVTTNLPPS
jgi:hypothetical protein